MPWIDPERPRSRGELRRYGVVMALALAALAGLLRWRAADAWVWPLVPAAVFLLLAVTVPGLLRPVERAWMGLARALSRVVTPVILTLVFGLAVTPLGWIMRRVSGDTLGKRPDARRRTYWEPVDAEGSAGRPDRPF